MSPLLLLKILLVAVLILAIPTAYMGYQAHINSTAYLMAKGNEAVEKLNGKEVERIQKLLEKKGETQAAYLLGGKYLVYLGDTALKRLPAAPPFEETQQAVQLVSGGAGLADQAMCTRGLIWALASFYQKPGRVSSPALNAFSQGLAELAKIQDDGPIGVEGTILAAECLLRLDEKRLAEEGLKALIKRHPDNMEAHRFLSIIYLDLNSPGNAIKHLEEWARLDPNNGLPYRWIGLFQKDGNQEGEAIKAYENALTRQLKPDARADALKELAFIYLRSQGKPSNALEILAQGTEEFQNEPDILAMRVECLDGMGRDAEALALVEKAISDNPRNPKIMVLRARIYINNENKPEKALPLLEKAVQLDPYDPQAQNQLLNVYGQLGMKDQAAKQKKEVEELTRILTTLANLKSKADNAPWDDQPCLELGALFIKIGRMEDARTWLQATLSRNPGNVKARRLLRQLPAQEKPVIQPDSTAPNR
jgi:tetratricopeptide (TPR) repeat protein